MLSVNIEFTSQAVASQLHYFMEIKPHLHNTVFYVTYSRRFKDISMNDMLAPATVYKNTICANAAIMPLCLCSINERWNSFSHSTLTDN